MSIHEIFTENQKLPKGFSSYSLLLIPDGKWLDDIGVRRSYQLFKRFKLFGDTIGPDHLAAWLYSGWGSYGPLVDIEVYSAIYSLTSSEGQAVRSIYKNGLNRKKGMDFSGGYDIVRAKYFCAVYDLSFNHGPYIAFFDNLPNVPVITRAAMRGTMGSIDKPSKPSFLLQFSGISFNDVMAMLNELEFEIIRGKVNTKKLKMQQLKSRLVQSCTQVAEKFGKGIQLIKSVKEAIPLPSIKDIS
jgi:hypothetical protein